MTAIKLDIKSYFVDMGLSTNGSIWGLFLFQCISDLILKDQGPTKNKVQNYLGAFGDWLTGYTAFLVKQNTEFQFADVAP